MSNRESFQSPVTNRSGKIPALFFFATVILSLSAAAAGARSLHLALSRAEPKADTTVSVAPTELRLFFTEAVKAAVTNVKLQAPDSSTIELAPLKLADAKAGVKVAPVIATIKGKVANGKHKVSWKTAGADGHAISGTYSFTVKAASPPATKSGGDR